jgi:hypothetical protein
MVTTTTTDLHAPTGEVWAVVEQEMRNSMPLRTRRPIRPNLSIVLTVGLALGLSLALALAGAFAGYAHARTVYQDRTRVLWHHTTTYQNIDHYHVRTVYVTGAPAAPVPVRTITRTITRTVTVPGPTTTVTATPPAPTPTTTP